MKRMKHLIAVISACIAVGSMQGKDFTVTSERRFTKLISKYRYAVAMFYERDKEIRRDEALNRRVVNTKNMFESLSESPFYEEADLAFLKMNVAKGDVDRIAHDHGIRKFPTFILFRNGTPVRDAAGNITMLGGFVGRTQLQQFIDERLREDLEAVTEKKEEERKRRLEEARERRYYDGSGVYLGIGYGYPYYGYGYGGYYGGRYGRGYYGRGYRRGYRGGFRRGGFRRGGFRGGRRGGFRGRRMGGRRGGGGRMGGRRGGGRGGGRRR